jgi:cysteine desulfurase
VQWSFAPKNTNPFGLESAVTKARVYLDFAATSPLRREALDAMLPFLEHPTYNASSLHTEGRSAKAALEEAREQIARTLGAKRKEIVFTASGSEADTLAIVGSTKLHSGRRIVSCAIEHHAVLRTLEALRNQGYDIELLPVDNNGLVDPERFEAALTTDTALATIMYANNEIGTIEPIARFAEIAHRRGVIFHSDAVQAPGWLDIGVQRLGVDLISLSAHKFGGPQGTGILYVKESAPAAPLIFGGGQEAGRRSGTENIAGAVGSAKALDLAESERVESEARVRSLRDMFEERVTSLVPGVTINAAQAARLPNIANLSFAGTTAESLAIRLDLEGIAASPGSACTSGVAEASHVIAALGTGNPRASLRFSLGSGTHEQDIERLLAVLPDAVLALRRGE